MCHEGILLIISLVGLTPGFLIVALLGRWLTGLAGSRQGRQSHREQKSMLRPLRRIDRILTRATPSEDGKLSYHEYGMLLCELHVLRQTTESVLSGVMLDEFCEELRDLANLDTGVQRQLRVVDRIRWAFAR